MENTKLISIVIPCYNEEKNIERFPKEIIQVLRDSLKYPFEIIAVDDGTTKDNTWGALKKVAEENPEFIALKHSRNYGMGAAYQSAFDEAKGDYIITYSSDLEIPAESIIDVVKELDKGSDFVNTYRAGRWQESLTGSIIRRIPSEIANKLILKISGVQVKDTGSGLKGFRKFIIDNLRIYGDMHRFLPAYSSLYTKKISEIEVKYQERTYGTPAYGSLKRTFAVFLD
ncbi:MAG: glycosyltransferase family 2 protein, partial [bacterium]|nr:glycosyltransferase family 2 protein [bacterium]